MRMKVVTCIRLKGDKGKISGKPYDLLAVGGVIKTARGEEFAEITLDGDSPVPESGKEYEVEMGFYTDREKKLQFRVEALRLVTAAPLGKVA